MRLTIEEWERRLPAALRLLRQQRQLSQEDLARRSGLSPASLSKWERGLAEPGLLRLLRFLSTLDFELSDLEKAVRRVAPWEDGDEEGFEAPEAVQPTPRVRRRAPVAPSQGGSSVRQEAYVVWRVAEEVVEGDAEHADLFQDVFDHLRDAVNRQIWMREAERRRVDEPANPAPPLSNGAATTGDSAEDVG